MHCEISLIGAPGNMIAQAGLQQAGLGSFGFFDYGLVGLPILIVVSRIVALILLPILFPF